MLLNLYTLYLNEQSQIAVAQGANTLPQNSR